MAKFLVVVESPAKAHTINSFLGKDYVVTASMGHIKDLPKSEMGVDIEQGFKPHYVTISRSRKIISELKKKGQGKEKIFLAPDPDREGEAIAFHLSQIFKNKNIFRVNFNEITRAAVVKAFENPGSIDLNKVQSQQGRRILDRIVGYSISPLLWKKVAKGLSAGRVQSVALRFIVEREKEIKDFQAREYWTVEAELHKPQATSHKPQVKEEEIKEKFTAELRKIEDKKVEIKNEETANKIVEKLKNEKFIVSKIEKRQKKRNPYPPFITSKLQQEAFNKLRFSASQTMRIAQQLYEGIKIEKERVGLITYMRTDSVRCSKDALDEVRKYIKEEFSEKYLPAVPHKYKSKSSAQGAHECIRPTSLARKPEGIKNFLDEQQYKLYKLIYNRFVASQMKSALFSTTDVEITAGKYLFVASTLKMLFAGFLLIYPTEKEEKRFPELNQNEVLELLKLDKAQHFTKPPPRYSDASLVKILEEKGIGRPSTYAAIIKVLTQRSYVQREKGYFFPTELGIAVVDLLIIHFPTVLDPQFTAKMEENLDKVEENEQNWIEMLKDFYQPFSEDLNKAKENMREVKKDVIVTDETCEKCGSPMVIKWGRKGKFLACSGFPACKNTRSISTGIKCPQEGCNGELIERHSKRGVFYGCSNYPECKYTARELPKEN